MPISRSPIHISGSPKPVSGIGETGEKRDLVIFKDKPINNHMYGKLLPRTFH